MKRQRRAVVTSTVPVTLNTFHRELLRQLGETHEVHVVTSPGSELAELERELGVTAHEIPMVREITPRADAAALLAWIRLLLRLRPQVIVSATPKASLLAQLAGRMTAVPKRLYYCGGLRLEGEQGRRRQLLTVLERATAACAGAVVVNSPSLARRAHELSLFPAKKLHATTPASSHGVDTAHFAPRPRDEALVSELDLGDGKPVIGFVGRLTHDKGIDTLIAGLDLLQRRVGPVHLVVVGPADELDSARYVTALRALGARVHLVGRQRDVRPYFSVMDVHVLPSHREGFPNVVLEAGAMGVPTVTTDATGCYDSVIPGETGERHAVGDAEGFADAVASVLLDRERYGAAARQWAAASFAPRDVVRSLLAPLGLHETGR